MTGKLYNNIKKSFHSNFEYICISGLIDAYNKAINDNQYQIDWKENSFTNYIAIFLRKSETIIKRYIRVDVQVQPENNNIPVENTDNDPDRQPIIDFRLANWNSEGNNEYFIEAKNICSQDWQKSDGSKVSASKLKRRYIKTGIENFITERYPKGCLAGYVIKTSSKECVEGVNKLLIKDNRESEKLKKFNYVEKFNNTFLSTHKLNSSKHGLKHIFLEFK